MQNRMVDKLFTTTPRVDPTTRSETDELRTLRDASLQQLDRTRERIEAFIAAHPAISLGAALVAGITLGWWVKRK